MDCFKAVASEDSFLVWCFKIQKLCKVERGMLLALSYSLYVEWTVHGCDYTGRFDPDSAIFSPGSLPDQTTWSQLHVCKIVFTLAVLMSTLYVLFLNL